MNLDASLRCVGCSSRAIIALALAIALFAALQVPACAQGNELQLRSVARARGSLMRPGSVLQLRANVSNAGQTSARGILVVTLEGFEQREYASEVELPGQQQALFDIAVHVPNTIAQVAAKKKRRGLDGLIEVTTRLFIKDESGQEVLQQQNGKPAEYRVPLSVLHNDTLPIIAEILDPEPVGQPYWHWPGALPYASKELLNAFRIDGSKQLFAANFDNRPAPLSHADWELFDSIVIAEEQAFADAAFVDSLKRFVHGGGRVWIQLDQVHPSSIRPILSPGQLCELVEEVQLTSFVIQLKENLTELVEQDRRVEVYQPVAMQHVLQVGGRVTHEVDGWPAVIRMPSGYGELILTTLDSRAWMEPRLDRKRVYASFKGRIWADSFAADFNTETFQKPLSKPVAYPLSHAGNRVIGKGWIALALLSFCLLLLLVGVWQFWAGDLRWLGLLAPAMAVVVAGVLLVAASSMRSDVPESNTRLQLIEVTNDGNSAIVREQSAVYLADVANMTLQSSSDGRATVDESVRSGIARVVTTEESDWKLENSDWPKGAWRYTSEYTLPTEGLIASGELSKDGLTLSLPELPSPLSDPVLNYTVGDPMLCSVRGQQLTCDGSVLADGERWVSGALIDKEQQRRSEVYQAYFKSDERTLRLEHVLCGWTELWPNRPSWSKDLKQLGAALVVLPIQLKRPASGQEVFVPHGLVKLKRLTTELGSTPVFSDRTGKWIPDLTLAADAQMQWVLPAELLPFQASAIEIELDMSAPHRDVTLSIETENGPVRVAQISNPSVPWSTTLTDQDVLKAAEDGKLDVTLSVSERTDSRGSNTVVAWEVQKLVASFRGQVTE